MVKNESIHIFKESNLNDWAPPVADRAHRPPISLLPWIKMGEQMRRLFYILHSASPMIDDGWSL
jgi:hypothetical protein